MPRSSTFERLKYDPEDDFKEEEDPFDSVSLASSTERSTAPLQKARSIPQRAELPPAAEEGENANVRQPCPASLAVALKTAVVLLVLACGLLLIQGDASSTS
eukprot:1579345-Prymnesium_polylepis.4